MTQPPIKHCISKPVSKDAFEMLMRPYHIQNSDVAVAVSGGVDSLALTVLLAQWCQQHGKVLHAVSINHDLRKEAPKELEQLSNWLQKHLIKHTILTLDWGGKPPQTAIQEQARKKRYQRLADYCIQYNIDRLFVAHHQEDQAETYLLRLSKGSGLDGLSCMDTISPYPVPLPSSQNTLKLCRPLLSIHKSELAATLQDLDQDWVEDPSNHNPHYKRVQVRTFLENKVIEGLDTTSINMSINRLKRIKSYLDIETNKAFSHGVMIEAAGYALLDLTSYHALHHEIRLRLLKKIVETVRNSYLHLKEEKLLALDHHLMQPRISGTTLAGCCFGSVEKKVGSQYCMIYREIKHIAEDNLDIKNHAPVIWDSRFIINAGCDGLIQRLTPDHWRHFTGAASITSSMAKEDQLTFNTIKMLPYPIRHTLPLLITSNGTMVLPNLQTTQSQKYREKTGFYATYYAK